MVKISRFVIEDCNGSTYLVTRVEFATCLRAWRRRGAYIERLGACRYHITVRGGSADVHPADSLASMRAARESLRAIRLDRAEVLA